MARTPLSVHLPRNKTLRHASAALALCLALNAMGCHTQYESGLEELAAGRYENAQVRARAGLRDNPEDPRFNLLMARSLVKQAFEDPDKPKLKYVREALPFAQKAFEDEDFKAPAGRILGKIHWELGKPVDAIDAWRAARKQDPQSVGVIDYVQGMRTAMSTAMTFEDYKRAYALRVELKQLLEQHEATLSDPKKMPQVDYEELKDSVTPAQFEENLEFQAKGMQRTNESNEEVLKVVDKLIELNPTKPDYLLMRGRIQMRMGQIDAARSTFQSYALLGTTPSSELHVTRLKQIAREAKTNGVRGLAIEFYKQLLEITPDSDTGQRADLLRTLASLHYKLQEKKQGRAYVRAYLDNSRKSFKSQPMPASRYIDAAMLATGHDELLVETLLEEALRDAPSSSRLAERLASTYARRAATGDVERVWKTYVKKSQSPHNAMQTAANWARRRRNYSLAAYFYEQMASNSKASASDLRYLAQSYAQQGRTQDLKRTIERYINVRGGDERVLLQSAAMYSDQNMTKEAEELYKRAQRRSPKSSRIADSYANMLVKAGKPQEVHAVYKKWLKANGNTSDDYIHVGNRLTRMGRDQEALTYLNQAAKKGDVQSLLQIADVYVSQNRNDELTRTLELYLKRHKHRPTALQDVNRYYERANMLDQAAKSLEELVSLQPDNERYYERLIRIYTNQNRQQDIVRLLKSYLKTSRDPMRNLENIAQRLSWQGHAKALLGLYKEMLEENEKQDPKLYKIVAQTFAQMDRYRGYGRRRYGYGSAYGYPSTQPNRAANVELHRKKAKFFYKKYLETAKLSSSELSDFANQMSQNQFLDLSIRAYEMALKNTKKPQPRMYVNYARVLFEKGEGEKAEALLEKHHQGIKIGQDRYTADIARQLMQYGRWDAAEKYYKRLLKSRSSRNSSEAFRTLVTLYTQSERQGQIKNLINTYLSASRQPAYARRIIQEQMVREGRWKLAIEQLEQMSKTQTDSMEFQVGQMLYKAGDVDRAQTVLNNYATNHVQPHQAWTRVAAFYEQKAQPKLAKEAYDKAVSASVDKIDARLQRAPFLIMQGDIKRAEEDIEKVEANLSPYRINKFYYEVIQKFEAAGRYDLAHKYAKRALPNASRYKEQMLRTIARHEFASGDPVRRDRMIATIKTAGMSLYERISLMKSYGLIDEAITAIEEEAAVGDYISAANTIMKHGDLFISKGGIPRLMTAVQPLLDRSRPDARLEYELGMMLVSRGKEAQGALFLRAALDKGIKDALLPLANAYLKIGEPQRTVALFKKHIKGTPAPVRREQIQRIIDQHLALGHAAQADVLLNDLARDAQFTQAAFPVMLGQMMDQGQVLGAINLTSSLLNPKALRQTDSGILDMFSQEQLEGLDTFEMYLTGIKSLASRGYIPEALSLLDRVPKEQADELSVRELALTLESNRSGDGVDQAAKRLVAATETSTQDIVTMLSQAKVLLVTERHEQLEQMVKPYLKHSDTQVAFEAYNLLARSAYIKADTKGLDAYTAEYIATTPNKTDARARAISLYTTLGLDKQAVELSKQNTQLVPTAPHLRTQLSAAYRQGDLEAFSDSAKNLWKVDDQFLSHVTTRTLYLNAKGEYFDAALNPALKVYPEHNALLLAQVMKDFDRGDVDAARQKMLARLKQLDYQPVAIAELFAELYSQGLSVEIAKALAPKLPQDKLTRRAHSYIALSLLDLGLVQEAQAPLQAMLERSGDKEGFSIEMAYMLLDKGHYKQTIDLMDQILASNNTRATALLLRGVARLASGQAAQGEQDIQKSLALGSDPGWVLSLAATYAIRAKAYDKASSYLKQLSQQVSVDSTKNYPAMAISVWRREKQAKRGVAFVEKHMPWVLERYRSSMELTSALANLYEEAGQPEASFNMYEQSIARHMTDPSHTQLSTYFNNLAYHYAVANQEIDRGKGLARKAIGTSNARENTYIDTVGWLPYRDKDLAGAQQTMERAIRSDSGSREYKSEYYSHLAEILEARGQYSRASWIRAYHVVQDD